MLLLETTIFYLVFGVVVAVASYLQQGKPNSDDDGESVRESFGVALAMRLGSACLFWPFYLPMLLSAGQGGEEEARSNAPREESDGPIECDALAAAIAQVEAELDAALQGLDGWAEDVLNCEERRLVELRSAWRAQAERIRQLDRLLGETAAHVDPLAAAAAEIGAARHSEEVRRENLRQLAELRKQLHADLIGTLAWVRELVTMIHLAKFSGAPAARAEELVVQIAAAVQGLSEVSAWREEEVKC
ncbi:hypothetical protein [Lacipirellula parvula]|uniref:Uncharacterized protein n=1 Tax=Lacipirellula parvula TaxID=2650471 RepID=A0A5K7XLZ0_9BACT|nr:hypothetical protein [Lacipirellula parvula]BBO35726.1 hypothetical protein PLANPX_5338 [Lacipirellula parvula]